ncbi:DNA-3-methyladenine glycosylase family protein [Ornithinimicrobium faecis]|uniref:DNA-3-methyladenine glycosylase family protein n=1 Tax=Ornithinimicrobium faecis TaxID=2934158 RepID=UPI0021193BB6|nr:hypothetical protein [Ornithinimicrobium sp. HY1745]
MTVHDDVVEVRGPWSLATSRTFWEGFAPAALPQGADDSVLRTTFLTEGDWRPATVTVSQEGAQAVLRVEGEGDLSAAVAQVCRFLALDVDASDWPAIGQRDPVIGRAQRLLPGLRPCGFHSPYEAAAWAVLSQRVRITQAARLRADLVRDLGEGGAFPTPTSLLAAELDLPGRKPEYLRAVAGAALDGLLNGVALRAVAPEEAVAQVQEIKGLGPFAAELVVLRGANAPDALPTHERRLDAEVAEHYGADANLPQIAEVWRPLRTWACVHLRCLREQRTGEIS